MAKTPPKDYFASVMFPGSKKLSIVSKRVGTKERLHAIATVTSEMVADRIVEALNHHQGALEKLEAPVQKLLDQTKEALAAERGVSRSLQLQITQLKNEINSLKSELEAAKRQRTQDHLAARQREAAYQG